jgi:hypothetical protein
MMYDHEKSDLAIVAVKPTNKARPGNRLRSWWSQGRGPRECESAKHGPGTVPGNRVTGAETHAEFRENITTRRHTPEVGEAVGRAAEVVASSSSIRTEGGCPVTQVNDLSRSLTAFDPISTLVVVAEMSKASWLVSSVVPGVERQPLKKLEPDATALLRLIER